MGINIGGTIKSPYDMETDTNPPVEVECHECVPPPPPAPSIADAQTEEVVVDYASAMLTAKVAFVVGAVTGLLLANFLRQPANNGQ